MGLLFRQIKILSPFIGQRGGLCTFAGINNVGYEQTKYLYTG